MQKCAAFFAKHHIAGDTLVPADFDFETCRQELSQHMYSHYGDKAVRNIREHMVFLELFSGFYPLLNNLLNKYHAVYQGYVQQYIQPTKKRPIGTISLYRTESV